MKEVISERDCSLSEAENMLTASPGHDTELTVSEASVLEL